MGLGSQFRGSWQQGFFGASTVRLKSDHPIIKERDNDENNAAKDLQSASTIQKKLIWKKLQMMADANPEL